jgi:hypothetical protein
VSWTRRVGRSASRPGGNELAHILQFERDDRLERAQQDPGHGPLYVQGYLELVGAAFGREVRTGLGRAFIADRVKF